MLVIDASVAVKFLIAEEGAADAAALLKSKEPLIAPDWLLIETGHALWKNVRLETISQETAIQALNALPAFFQALHSTPELLSAAYGLAFELNHWLYDCFYLELARREGAMLVTADRKFVNAANRGGYGERIVLLGSRL